MNKLLYLSYQWLQIGELLGKHCTMWKTICATCLSEMWNHDYHRPSQEQEWTGRGGFRGCPSSAPDPWSQSCGQRWPWWTKQSGHPGNMWKHCLWNVRPVLLLMFHANTCRVSDCVTDMCGKRVCLFYISFILHTYVWYTHVLLYVYMYVSAMTWIQLFKFIITLRLGGRGRLTGI